MGKLTHPYGQPPLQSHVLWRCELKQYSVVVDAERDLYGVSDPVLEMQWFRIVARTPCGAWITWGFGGKDKFVRLTARKRWACETEDEALRSFVARSKRYRAVLRARLKIVEQGLSMVLEHVSEHEIGRNLTQQDSERGAALGI